ncbi:hypothetical protein Hokovirus_1_202 [Hokovirus HKV1]|uniref:Uncharacterized protein n=1 Tax=Hokovirus HKV1 TaxID=1977638 RepID=A0A1V0SF39_9VIRU|nr:hypothetical protein Hokovirus_1_202 [Hokovirus HKV1]
MYIYILIKILFLILDSTCLYYYIKTIIRNKCYTFLFLTIITGSLCLYTSVYNINTLINNDIIHVKQIEYYEYLIFRCFTFLLEWCQYWIFLWFLFNNQFSKLVFNIIVSIIVIYYNYVLIEILEYELTNIEQEVMPIFFLFM